MNISPMFFLMKCLLKKNEVKTSKVVFFKILNQSPLPRFGKKLYLTDDIN